MRSRPHPFVPLQPNKMVLSQGVLPTLTPSPNAPAAPAVIALAKAPVSACFNCGQNGQFACECPNRDQARKLGGGQHNLDEAEKAIVDIYAECVLEKCSGMQCCVNCGMMDHVASQFMQNPVSDDIAFSRWVETEAAGIAAQTIPAEGDRVLVQHPAVLPATSPPLTVTCGDKQVQTRLEPTTFDPLGRTLISVHLVLAVEREQRPNLTLRELWLELAANPA